MAERVASLLFSSTIVLNLGMDFLSEQEVEAGPSYASEGGESSAGKEIFEGGAIADAYTTPAEKGGQALVLESRRQYEESLEEVNILSSSLRMETLGRN